MKRCLASLAGLIVALTVSESAFAQAASSGASAEPFNPFATFSLSRFTFNTLGFLQVDAPSAASATTPTALGGDSEDDAPPLAVVIRPPYRPPVRSPYRPPPRPPF
jgi:hypothetical protein